jgi:hypothetical protein
MNYSAYILVEVVEAQRQYNDVDFPNSCCVSDRLYFVMITRICLMLAKLTLATASGVSAENLAVFDTLPTYNSIFATRVRMSHTAVP